jgi:peroxiredoxin family protein
MKSVINENEIGLIEERLSALEDRLKSPHVLTQEGQNSNKISIICFSGEWDRLFAALTLASGSLAMGMDVNLFFTFWAVSALRNGQKYTANGRSFLQKMFANMLPSGINKARLSKFNFFGFGKLMLKRVLKDKGIEDIDTLFQEVIDMGANIYLCDNTSELFGLSSPELHLGQELQRCGVATFLSEAIKSKTALFI